MMKIIGSLLVIILIPVCIVFSFIDPIQDQGGVSNDPQD